MVLIEVTVPIADAVEGFDILANLKWACESKYKRQIVGASLVGSNAVDDTRVGLYYGSVKIGQIYNSNTGLTTDISADMKPHHSALVCMPEDALSAIIEDPASTNPIKLILDVAEIP